MSNKTDELPSVKRKQTLYVTARHARLNRGATDPHEVPFGAAHVREPGGAETACGLAALNWPIFWDVTLSPGLDMCVECRDAAWVDQRQRQR
jgi:hypothetical protein